MWKSILFYFEFFSFFLNGKLKYKYFQILGLSIISIFLEILSVWLLVPLLSLLLNGDDNIFAFFRSVFGLDINSLVSMRAFFILFLFFVIFSTFLRLWITKKKLDFIYNRIFVFSVHNLVLSFLNSSFFSKGKKEYGDFVSMVSTKIEIICTKFVLASLNLVSSFFQLILFLILAFWLSPNELIYLFFIFAPYFLFTFFIRPYLVVQGNNINSSLSNLVKNVSVAYSNFTEIKLYRLNNKILSNLDRLTLLYSRSVSNNSFYADMPRQLLEVILVISVILFFFLKGEDTDNLLNSLPRLIALGLILQKLLPIVQIVYSSFSSMISSEAIVKEFKNTIESAYKNQDLLEIRSEKNTDKFVFSELKIKNPKIELDDFTLDINFIGSVFPGEKVGVFGKSGTGKSTFIHCLIGLLPCSGIQWQGKDFSNFNFPLFSDIGYSGQKPVLFGKDIFENITLLDQKDISDQIKIEVINILKGLSLAYLINNYSDEKVLTNLSGGELQRLSLGRLLFQNKSINFIDEGTSALDYETEKTVIEFLLERMKDKTIFFVTHSKQLSKYMNNSIFISNH